MDFKAFIFVLIFNSVFSYDLQNFDLSNENKNLLEAFKSVRYEFKKMSSTKGFNLISIKDPKAEEIHDTVKDEIIKFALETESIKLSNIESQSSGPSKYSVSIVDNIDRFKEQKVFINPSKFKSSGFHLVILLNGTIKDVDKIFAHYWSESIYDVITLINDNGTLLLNFEPFKAPDNCNDTSAIIANKFVNGNFLNPVNLRKQFNNLNQCSLNVLTFDDSVAVTREFIDNKTFVLRGHEFSMIQTIAKMLNFTLKVIYKEGTGQWGYVYKNGTCTLGFADLKNKKADIMVGDMYLKLLRAKYFDHSISFNNYPVFFLLSPESKLSWFQKLLKPFEATVWILLFMTFCIGIAVILFINRKFKNVKKFVYGNGTHCAIFNMIRIFVGQIQPNLPERNFARFILMMFIIFSFVIRGVYQGFLYKSLRSDGKSKAPQNLQELIDQEYSFVMSEPNLDFLKNYLPKNYDKSKIKEDDKINILKLSEASEKTATLSSKFEFIQYSINHTEFPYTISKKSFFTINIVMYYHKNFYLKSAIDMAIRKILIHGFMEHWTKEFDRRDKWKRKDKRPKVMTLEQLSGAFYLLIIGYIAAFLTVAGEIFVWKLNKVHKEEENLVIKFTPRAHRV